MKYLTGVIACGLMMAGFVTSTPALAMQTCQSCVNHYNTCVAAGGNPETCWSCNNPTCPPLVSKDNLESALGKISTKKSKLLTPALSHPVATVLDS